MDQFDGRKLDALGPDRLFGQGLEVLKYGQTSVDVSDLTSGLQMAGALLFSATDGDDELTGTDGNDQLHGLSGNDVIAAGAGDDQIAGGAGDDTLRTGAGDATNHDAELLWGGDARDNLVPSNGSDTYVIEREAGRDVRLTDVDIYDEAITESETDTLDLTGFAADLNDITFNRGADRLYVENGSARPGQALRSGCRGTEVRRPRSRHFGSRFS
jgi:Ca2+-binding RTX toxin-like protein